MKAGKVLAETDKGVHVWSKVFAFMINNIQGPSERLLKGNDFYQVFTGVSFHQQIRKDCHTQSLKLR